jgi:hypothetical protein
MVPQPRRETRRISKGGLIFMGIFYLGMAAAGVWLWAGSAFGQEQPSPNCGPRMAIAYKLANEYLESPLIFGTPGEAPQPDAITEIWGNPETGTWTIVVSKPDGSACVVSGGHNLALIPYVAPITGAPA